MRAAANSIANGLLLLVCVLSLLVIGWVPVLCLSLWSVAGGPALSFLWPLPTHAQCRHLVQASVAEQLGGVTRAQSKAQPSFPPSFGIYDGLLQARRLLSDDTLTQHK
jgi:hypothetical protein